MSSSLKLYVDANFLSPFAMFAYVALEEKNLAYELLSINLKDKQQHSEAYAALSLTRKVPMLVHDGFALSESSAITEYLDENFPGIALYPDEPQARARARQIQAWLRTDLLALRQERSTEHVFLSPTAQPLSEDALQAANKLCVIAETLVPQHAESLFGAWSIADTELALMLNRLLKAGDAVPERLARYATQQWQRPTVQSWVQKASCN